MYGDVMAGVPARRAALSAARDPGRACSPATPPVRAAVNAAQGPGGLPSTPGRGHLTLSETGSTLSRTWAASYHSDHSQATIPTGTTGSGAGIVAVSPGTVDIGACDAYLPSGSLAENPRLLNIPLAISAQVYQGRITRWNDPAIASLNPRVRLPGAAVVPLSAKHAVWSNAYGHGTSVRRPRIAELAGLANDVRPRTWS